MIKTEMDFEWHLIRFCHGAVVHKQVAQPPVAERSGESWRGSAWEISSRIRRSVFPTTLRRKV